MGLRSNMRQAIGRALAPPPVAPEPLPGDSPTALDRVVQRLDAIANTITGLGGTKDKGRAARPTWRAPLEYDELTWLYRQDGYAQQFVDSIADDATRKGWRVVDSSTEQAVLGDEEERLSIWSRVGDCYRWARLHGGALIFIVVDEEGPVDLAQPLDPAKVKAVQNLVVLDRSEADPATYEGSVRATNRFRHPKTWYVTPQAGTTITGLGVGGEVHHTRLLYIPGKRLPARVRYENGGYDDSILEGAWDQIRNISQSDSALAHIWQELQLHVLTMDDLQPADSGDQADALTLRAKAMAQTRSLTGSIILTKGERYETLFAPMTGVADLKTEAKASLAAVTGQPQTRIFGEAPGGLNTDGESSRRWWDRGVAACQEANLREPLTWLYTILLHAAVRQGILDKMPESWVLEFNPLDELTEQEQAELQESHARADALRMEWGVVTPEHIARSRFGAKGYQNELLPVEDKEGTAARDIEKEAAADVARMMEEETEVAEAPAAEAESDKAATLNELSLTIERLARIGDYKMVNAFRRKMAGTLNAPYPGDLAKPPDPEPVSGRDDATPQPRAPAASEE